MQFADAVKKTIEQMACPTHDMHPIVEHDVEGMAIHCCCNEFHSQCTKESERLLAALPPRGHVITLPAVFGPQ